MLNAVMVELPQPVFDQLIQVADRQKRSVPDLVDSFVKQAMPPATLQDEVARDLFALSGFPNEVLILLAQNPMPPAYQEELATLNEKAQRTALLTQNGSVAYSWWLASPFFGRFRSGVMSFTHPNSA